MGIQIINLNMEQGRYNDYIFRITKISQGPVS